MFGFFKDKSIEKAIKIAKDATIDAALEQGMYSGFIIKIKVSRDEVAKYWKKQEALDAFVAEVEERIENDRFDYPIEKNLGGIVFQGETGKKSALRAVFTQENNLLVKWNR